MLRESDFLWTIWPESYSWNPNCLENLSVSMLFMEASKCWNIVEFPKLSIKIKNFKTFYEAQAVRRLKEVIQLLSEIHRIIQIFSFPVFWKCSSRAFRNGAVQIFFSDTNQEHVCWKICKVSEFSAVLREYIFYNVEWLEVCNVSKAFKAKWCCKISELSYQFLKALRISAGES